MLNKLNHFEIINATYLAQAIYQLIKLEVFEKLLLKSQTIEELSNDLKINHIKIKTFINIAIAADLIGKKKDSLFLRKKGLMLTKNIKSWERDYYLIWGGGINKGIINSELWINSDMDAYEIGNEKKLWDHYREDRDLGFSFENFQDRISSLSHFPEIFKNLKLNNNERIIDIAGGKGSLLLYLHQKNPTIRGCILDQKHMHPAFFENLESIKSEGFLPDIDFIPGDMLSHIPPQFDTYIIKHALHDWPDDSVIKILSNISSSMSESSRLLIIEGVNENNNSLLLQTRAYEQAIWTSGRVRTRSDFENLTKHSNLYIKEIKNTNIFDLSIIECVKKI